MANKYVVQMSKESGEPYLILDKTARAQISEEVTAREAAVAAEATARETANSNLEKSINVFDMVIGYIDGDTGSEHSGNAFCHTKNRIKLEDGQMICYQFNSNNHINDRFVSYYNGEAFIKNETFSEKFIHGISEADSVRVNFRSDTNFDNPVPEKLKITYKKKNELTWEQGFLSGETGEKNSSSLYGIYTYDFIRICKKDIVDIHLVDATGRSFYVLFYDSTGKFVENLVEEGKNTEAIEITGKDGFIRIGIYDVNTISPETGNNVLNVILPMESVQITQNEFANNDRNYISQQDYFETALDHFSPVWSQGNYINESGEIARNADAMLTGLLKVEPGAYYQTKQQIAGYTYDGRIIYYNSEYQFIGYILITSKQVYFKIPENCEYVRICANKNNYKDYIFVRPSHIADPQFVRDDDRVFISRWFKNRYGIRKINKNVELIAENIYFSDFIPTVPGSFYIIPPDSSLYGSPDIGISQYDENKNKIAETTQTAQHYFVTGSTCKYIRIALTNTYFNSGACYIEKSFNKETNAVGLSYTNGYVDGTNGQFVYGSNFMRNTAPINTADQKQIDIFVDGVDFKSIFLSLFNDGSFLKNISFDYNKKHIRFVVPQIANKIYVNFMSEESISISETSPHVTVCLSRESKKTHFSIAEYVESTRPNKNFILRASSKSNILPIGIDYNTEEMLEAFTRSDVGEEIASRGLDAPCVFWDSIKCRWGITFTAYREDEVSEYGSIYSAHSSDLINWIQDGPIIERNLEDPLSPDYGTVGGSYVFIKDEKYYVFYNGGMERGFEAGKYTICLAVGDDLTNLEKVSENPIIIGADSSGQWYSANKAYRPSVIQWGDGVYYMFFNARNSEHSGGNKWHEYIGYAVSKDLIHWDIQGQILDNMSERNFDHYVTGDPCFYDVGDEYIYATVFTCFNESGIDWSKTGVGIMRTTKENFPVGWKMIRNNVTGAHKNKSFVVYKNGRQYAFMADTYRAILYRIADE